MHLYKFLNKIKFQGIKILMWLIFIILRKIKNFSIMTKFCTKQHGFRFNPRQRPPLSRSSLKHHTVISSGQVTKLRMRLSLSWLHLAVSALPAAAVKGLPPTWHCSMLYCSLKTGHNHAWLSWSPSEATCFYTKVLNIRASKSACSEHFNCNISPQRCKTNLDKAIILSFNCTANKSHFY